MKAALGRTMKDTVNRVKEKHQAEAKKMLRESIII